MVDCNDQQQAVQVSPEAAQVLMWHVATACVGCDQVQPLKRTALILPEQYPSFTLLRQAVGATKLGYEALSLLVPEVRSQQCKQSQSCASACAGAQTSVHADSCRL